MKRLLLIMFACGVIGSSITYGEPRQIDLDTMSKEELMALAGEISDKISEIGSTEEIESDSIWQIKYYVDAFDYPTDDPYLTTDTIDGKFSNTAATKAKLSVRLLLDKTVSIKLYEYGEMLVKGYYSKGERYDIYFRRSDGSDGYAVGYLNDGSDRVSLNEKASARFFKALCDSDSLSILMYPSEHSATEYRFDISDTNGFREAYESVFGPLEFEEQ